MAFVDGEPLSSRIAAAGALTVGETMSVVAQGGVALPAVHGVVDAHHERPPGAQRVPGGDDRLLAGAPEGRAFIGFTVNRLIVKPRRSRSNRLRSCVTLAMITAVRPACWSDSASRFRSQAHPWPKRGTVGGTVGVRTPTRQSAFALAYLPRRDPAVIDQRLPALQQRRGPCRHTCGVSPQKGRRPP
jgi:hypothetical protein